MKRRLLVVVLLNSALALTACAEIYSGTLILDGSHAVPSGEILRGDVLMLDGSLQVQQGGRIAGSLYLMGGEADIQGEVGGELAVIGGDLKLGSRAHIGEQLSVGGGTLDQAPGAQIEGGVQRGMQVPLSKDWAERVERRRMVSLLVESAILALLSLPVARFFPRQVKRISQAATRHPLVAGSVGALTLVVGVSLVVMMAFTVILIPVSVLAFLLGVLALGLGWIGLGAWLGERLARRLGWRLTFPWQAAMGTLIVMLVMNGLTWVPLAGGAAGLLLISVALGAALLTRLGFQAYVPAVESFDPSQYEAAPPQAT